MERIPDNEFDGAQKVLRKYHRSLVQRAASEIISNKDEFESANSYQVDEIIEKYAMKLHHLGQVFCSVNQFVHKEKPKGSEPLGKDEFRCFGCGGVIRQQDEKCKTCGWTWQ